MYCTKFGPLRLFPVISTCTNFRQMSVRSKEIYQSEGRFRNNQEVAQYLAASIVYHDPENDPHGLMAINKPNGLAARSLPGEGDSKLSFTGALPILAEMLEIEELHYISMPERLVIPATTREIPYLFIYTISDIPYLFVL